MAIRPAKRHSTESKLRRYIDDTTTLSFAGDVSETLEVFPWLLQHNFNLFSRTEKAAPRVNIGQFVYLLSRDIYEWNESLCNQL